MLDVTYTFGRVSCKWRCVLNVTNECQANRDNDRCGPQPSDDVSTRRVLESVNLDWEYSPDGEYSLLLSYPLKPKAMNKLFIMYILQEMLEDFKAVYVKLTYTKEQYERTSLGICNYLFKVRMDFKLKYTDRTAIIELMKPFAGDREIPSLYWYNIDVKGYLRRIEVIEATMEYLQEAIELEVSHLDDKSYDQ